MKTDVSRHAEVDRLDRMFHMKLLNVICWKMAAPSYLVSCVGQTWLVYLQTRKGTQKHRENKMFLHHTLK